MILVCGEALIDVFSTGSSGGALSMEGHVGGSPFNVAVGAARLGREVAFLGALSDDFFGRHLRQALASEGVRLDHVKHSRHPSPLSFVSVAADGLVAYSFRNEGAADHDILDADLPTDLDGVVTCITLGSYTLGLEPSGESVLRLAENARASRVVSFDPNLRPDLIADEDVWRGRFERAIAASTIVKISSEDIGHAFEPGADVDALAREWLAKGPALVLVTDGPQPVRAYGAFGRIEVQGPQVEVIDTVGAGDSFHAALLSHLEAEGLMSREALVVLDAASARRAVEYAARAAAITCSRRGADLPRSADLA
ncbi:carbohydrate kinase family protein [Aureimonas mangrovi]|uniref:carbohydrate kinase family protein n=1 Tax=Aureimonas mangrovi TaxID=2758041 RepID=UPI00163DB212|nr:carbohydrate kinase [Aureimonas mangrovi]